VDLVVEDRQAEDMERARARKEGGPGWNSIEQKHFVKTYPDEEDAEEVRQGFNPDQPERKITDEGHKLDDPFEIGDGGDDDDASGSGAQADKDEAGRDQPWESRAYGAEERKSSAATSPLFEEERNAWGDGK